MKNNMTAVRNPAIERTTAISHSWKISGTTDVGEGVVVFVEEFDIVVVVASKFEDDMILFWFWACDTWDSYMKICVFVYPTKWYWLNDTLDYDATFKLYTQLYVCNTENSREPFLSETILFN